MVQLSITNHIVDRYRERVKEDLLRAEKSSKSIRRIIASSIKSHPSWRALEAFVSGEMDLSVDLSDNGNNFGQYHLIFCKNLGKGRSYSLITLY